MVCKLNKEKNNVMMGFGVALILIFGGLALILTPFSVSNWLDSGKEYKYNVHFFGHWSLYENTTKIDEGGVTDLTNFPISSSVLILLGISMSMIFVIILGTSIGKYSRFYQFRNQIFGAFIFLGGAFGFTGALIFRTYLATIRLTYANARLSSGFILAMVLFSLVILLGIGSTLFGRVSDPPISFAKKKDEEIEVNE